MLLAKQRLTSHCSSSGTSARSAGSSGL